ncbi:MAG: AAA family ATPase [Acidobacteria bacterium]|nr:AAA family ATPase [Acidobacteriota bacterium]
MRIESVAVKNLRCIKDGVVNLDAYTCLVGPNGAGKSTLLHALNIFFRHVDDASTDVTSLTPEDFHLHDTSKPIEITVTFTDLPKEAEEEFKEYVRQGKLIVSVKATFDAKSNRAEVKQFGQRLGMAAFKPFFRAYGDNALVRDLIPVFEGLAKDFPDLAAKKSKKSKDAMYATLREFEAERPDLWEIIASEDQFYGVSKGKDRLEKYVQWVFIPAVKDACAEQSETKGGALGKLLARTVRANVNFSTTLGTLVATAREQYQKMLDDNETVLRGVSNALQKRLAEWAHPAATLRVAWQHDSTKAVKVDPPLAGIIAGESGFEGSLVRFGHGFQRSYLLALLQELAAGDDKTAPTLILGCEEPELYQHPPQSRHLAGVFDKLSQDNAQIVVTTHSPYFVSGKNFESVRMVRRNLADNCASIRQYSYSKVAERFAEVVGEPPKEKSAALSKVHQALQPALNEMFFTQRLVLVEGLEDIAYVHSWLILTERWEEYRRSGCHIVAVDGKSEMIRPAIIAQGLGIPVFAVVDADGDKIGDPKNLTRHHRDNAALIRLFDGDANNLFPVTNYWLSNLVMWPSNLADTVNREIIEALGVQGAEQFEHMENKASLECGNAGDLKKNAVYIGNLLEMVREAGVTSRSLDQLCKLIITFNQ